MSELKNYSDLALFKAIAKDPETAKGLASQIYGVPEELLRQVETQESGGKQTAISPKGAIGRLQLMPDTAKGLQVNPHDEIENIWGGTKYLSQQYKDFGNWPDALRAYNWGPENLKKHGKGKAPQETRGYVASIMGALGWPTEAEAGVSEMSNEELAKVAGVSLSAKANVDVSKMSDAELIKIAGIKKAPVQPIPSSDPLEAAAAFKGLEPPESSEAAQRLGKAIERGGKESVASTLDLLSNIPYVAGKIARPDVSAFQAAGLPLPSGLETTAEAGLRGLAERVGPEPPEGVSPELARPYAQRVGTSLKEDELGRYLTGKGMAPEEETISEAIVRGLAAAPLTVAQYVPLSMLFGPIGGMAATDALRAARGTPEEILKAALKGAVMGGGIKFVSGFQPLTRVAGMGVLGGGAAAWEGGGVNEITSGAAVMGVLGALGPHRSVVKIDKMLEGLGGKDWARSFESNLKKAYYRMNPQAEIGRSTSEIITEIAANPEKFGEMVQKVPALQDSMKQFNSLSDKLVAEAMTEKQAEDIQAQLTPVEKPPPPPPAVDTTRPATGPLFTPKQMKTMTHEEVMALPPEQQRIFQRELKEQKAQAEDKAAEKPKPTLRKAEPKPKEVEVAAETPAKAPEPAPVAPVEGVKGVGRVKPTPTPPAAKEPTPEILPTEPVGKGEGEEVYPRAPIYMIPTKSIKTDPETFQFKAGYELKTGEGLALTDVKKWDQGIAGKLTLWKKADGESYVVNGHQRVALAKRTNTSEVPAEIIRESDGWTLEKARAYGALINLAEGKGTEVDLAKFIRDTGLTTDDLSNRGISLTDSKTRRAVALTNLSDALFTEAALGRLSTERAAIIGEELADNKPAQDAIFKTVLSLERKFDIPNEKLRELIRAAKSAPLTSEKQVDLFGTREVQKSLLLEQADLVSYAKKQLRQDKNIFGMAGREKERLEKAGNVVDKETNQIISRESAEALDIMDKAPYIPGGRTNALVKEYAPLLAKAKDKGKIRSEFYGKLKEAIATDRKELLGIGAEVAGRGAGEKPPTVPKREGISAISPRAGEAREIPSAKREKAEGGKVTKFYGGGPDTKELVKQALNIGGKRTEAARVASTPEGREVEQMFERADKELKELKKPKFKRIMETVKQLTIDTSATIKRDLLNQAGIEGKKAVMKHDLSRGANPKAQQIYEDAAGRIYDGLSPAEELILNRIIQSRRTIAIDSYKPDMEHPGGLTGENHRIYLDSIPKKVMDKLNPRVDEYFATMKANLGEMKKAGLISDKQYKDLVTKGDYSPRWFIQHMDPDIIGFDGRGRKITVPDSGIKKLDEGSIQMLENDSRLLLSQTITRTQVRIAKNAANLAAREVAIQFPDNGMFRRGKWIKKVKKGSEPEFSWEEAPLDYDMTKEVKPDKITYGWEKPKAGETHIDVMVDGKKERLIMPDKYAREWVQSDPLISQTAANIIGWASGTKILKAFATGYNPGFALTNLPRDIAHIWLVTNEYSTFGPKFTGQMGKDLMTVLPDVIGWQSIKQLPKDIYQGRGVIKSLKQLERGQLYKDYIDQGGGMGFLTHQGQLKPLIGPLGGLQKILGWVGETSEIWTRLAVRERAIKNGATPEEATWIARNYLDFSQGGSFSKAADSAIPYLNASIQGTRMIVKAAHADPKTFLWKVGQVGALATGLYLANTICNKEAWDQVPEREKVTNWIITTPLSYRDKDGNKRYLYFRIAKDQGQRVFATLFETLMGKAMGHKIDTDQVVMGIADFLPIVPTEKLPPAFSAMLGYAGNKDFWRNRDVWKGPKVESRMEYNKFTHPALVKAGEYSGLSPERLGYALNQFIPSTNTYVAIVSGALSKMLEDLPENMKQKTTEEIIQNIPMVNKILRSTDPYEKQRKIIEQTKTEENTRRYEQRIKIERIVDDTKDKPSVEKWKFANEYIKTQPSGDRDRLRTEFRQMEKYLDIPDRRWWLNLKHMPPESRAVVYWERYKNASEEERSRLDKQSRKLPGIRTEKFSLQLIRLRKGQPKTETSEID